MKSILRKKNHDPLGEICTIFQKNGPDFDFDWRPQSRMHHSLLDSEM